MRRFAGIFFILIFILFMGNAWAEYISNYDGNTWIGWDDSTKNAFIVGFMSGCNIVVEENQMGIAAKMYDLAVKEKKPKKTISEIFSHALDEKFRNEELKKYSLINIAAGQMSDGLNTLYQDFKNRNIKITDAIYVVKKQIQGASAEEVEGVLLFLRSGKVELDNLRIIDKEGKSKLITFP